MDMKSDFMICNSHPSQNTEKTQKGPRMRLGVLDQFSQTLSAHKKLFEFKNQNKKSLPPHFLPLNIPIHSYLWEIRKFFRSA